MLPNINITSRFEGRTFVLEASAQLKSSPQNVINSHTMPSYGKLISDVGEYSKFERQGNRIKCSFPQKISGYSFDMNFEKELVQDPIYPNHALVKFKTTGGIAKINGFWNITPSHGGTLLKLHQRVTIPVWAMFLPICNFTKDKTIRIINDTSKLP